MSNAAEIIREYDRQIWIQHVETEEREAECRNAKRLHQTFLAYMKKPGFKGTKELADELNKIATEKCSSK